MSNKGSAGSAPAPRENVDDALTASLWRFFGTTHTPAAICDENLVIQVANRAFGLRVGAQAEGALTGRPLEELVEADPPLGASGEDRSFVPVRLPGGRQAMATLITSDGYAVVTLDAGLEAARLARAQRATHDQERVFSIGRLLSLLMTEEDLVGVVAQGLREFFDGRSFCIRVIEPKTMELTSLYAEGNIKHDERERFTLKRSAVSKTKLPPALLKSDRIAVRTGYHQIFEGSETGIGVPLVAGNQLLGMINIEGTEAQFGDIESDERLAISLANQLGIALRNAKLIREARYLRGYLENLIENANALILVVDGEGCISLFNRACQELSGYTLDELEGTKFVELLPPEQRHRLDRLLNLAMRGKSATNVEVSVVAKNGNHIEVAFNTSPLVGADGQVEGVIAIGNDLTRLFELEAQVTHAERLASLGQLAAAVVHELNNPLTSITVYAESLRDGLAERDDSDAEVRKAERILVASERILRFTRDLVAYARPTEEMTTSLPLSEVIEESLRLCEHVVNGAGARIVRSWSDSLPPIQANRNKMQQVFINLITNACHAIDHGGTISLRANELDGWIEVQVKDNGKGMPTEVADRIFDPFFSTKPPGEGTGLGLSIVQGIVQRQGGTIVVESDPGHGTTFIIRIPLGAS